MRRLAIAFLILFLTLSLIGGAAAVVIMRGCINSWPVAPPVTEKDFKTDAERAAFLKRFLPVAMPASATNVRIYYDDYLSDVELNASFELGKEDFAAFASAARSSGSRTHSFGTLSDSTGRVIARIPRELGDDQMEYELPEHDGRGTLTLDELNGKVTVVVINSFRPKGAATTGTSGQ